MNTKELQIVDEKLSNVKASDIPEIITSQFSHLKDLKISVDSAIQKAEEAKCSADRAFNKSAGLGHKKEAIESLQRAAVDQGDALESLADAQKLSFNYQEHLGKITQFLFSLGVTNIAANRSIVRELELRLKGASEEELGALARQELLNVVKQLKAQEDIMNKQAFLSNKVAQHEKLITENVTKDTAQDKKIAEQAAKDAEHDRLLSERAAKDEEHDRLLSERAAKDEEHDRLLSERAAKDEEHDRLLSELTEKDEEHDRLLSERAEKDAGHDRLLSEQAAKSEEHDRLIAENISKNSDQDTLIKYLQTESEELKQRIETSEAEIQTLTDRVSEILDTKADKKTTVISFIIAGIGLVAAFIQFFI